jgi:hypothetical protein
MTTGGNVLTKTNRLTGRGASATQSRKTSPTVGSMMREVLHTLGNIDCEHELELDRLEISNTDQKLKNDIREKLLSRHRERREPYVELLTVLRQQQYRLAVAA